MIDIVDRLRDDATRTAWGANVHEQAREAADEIERLRSALKGWRLVPEEPTTEMIDAAFVWNLDREKIRAAIQAAPEPSIALVEVERLREAMRWRPASEPPSNSAPVLIVDEDGEVDIASWRACKDNLALHWHYRRGICTEALWWAPLPKGPE